VSSEKITISSPPEALEQLDRLVDTVLLPSHNRLIQVAEKLQPSAEQDAAEEFFRGEVGWPEY
jgi:hypothetical protein